MTSPTSTRGSRGTLNLAMVLALLFTGALTGSQPALAESPDILISQIYGGGGNAGATFKNDFIELFNRGIITVNVTGWSVQYASVAGSTWQKTTLSGSIAPGQFYLIQEAQGAGGTVNLPAPDATGTIPMSATGGKVALVNNSTTLTGTCPAGGGIVDFIGYDGANCFEGSPAPMLSNTTAALRVLGGCADTDNNLADFSLGAPNPRNTGSPINTCPIDAAPGVSSTTPAGGASNVALNANVVVNFSEPVNLSASWFTIACTDSSDHTATVTGGPTTFTLDPSPDFLNSESCTVTVLASQVTDLDTIDPPDVMAANFSWSFATVAPPTFIHDIQGAGHISPKNGLPVSDVAGIVTARLSNGFYMQDPNPDGDDATSEGIFVFTASNPSVNVGDAVLVSGTVAEFRPGGASTSNLTTTEIASPSIRVTSTGNPLPAATLIGSGGRIPPATIIEDDATGNVETSGVFDPASDGLDFYESLEGMRVQINDAVAVGPRNSFGEIPVAGDDGANAGLRTPRGGLIVQSSDFNPERIILDDAIAPTPLVDVGDHFTSPAVGVLDYSFGNFKLQVTTALTGVSGGLARESTALAGANQLAVATFNVENLDPGDGPTKFDELARLIVNNLRSPDIVALEEVQDNNGPTNDSVVDADVTLSTLIAAIQAAGGPTYQFRQVNPVDDQDGGEPGGNIRVGYLFRTDRGLTFIDRPGGGPLASTTVLSGPDGPELSSSPGRIDPANPAFNSSRKPLAAEFDFNGHHLFVIANHFNSKGGDLPLFGYVQPPTRISEVQRGQQAQVVNDFIDALLAVDASAEVVVLGDFNDFEFSTALTTLRGGVLNDLIETLPQNERYTYVFEGNSQALDHILVSQHLFNTRPFEYDVVHINAEFAIQASDHDPQVVRFLLNDPPTASAGGPYEVDEGGSVVVTASSDDLENGPLGYAWDLDNDGTFETPGQSVTFSAAGLDGPSSYLIKLRVTDDGGLTATAETMANVLNVAPSAGAIAAPADPAPVNTAVNLSASFTDPGVPDTHTAIWDWGDGGATPGIVTEANGSGSVSGNHAYTAAGVYIVRMTVTDDDRGSGQSALQYLVVFDPSGGFVTGGGRIASSAGAYAPDPGLAGTANFGFVCRYPRGSVVPTGPTEFQLQVAGLIFHSTRYDWLVIAGPKAQFKGSGTINGSGDYGFILTAIDGQVNAGADKFRIKVWDKSTGAVIFDSQPGDRDSAEPTTAIVGGSIVIHSD